MLFISILVAVRNEAAVIRTCLEKLAALNYDKNFLEILLGNDASEDETAAIIEEFIVDKPHFHLVTITKKVANLQGKANVLAQLAHHAHGEWLFFTDADVQVPTTWIEGLLQLEMPENQAIALRTGFTTVIPTTCFSTLQALDWTFYLGCVHVFSLVKLPMTAMGNNMAVKKEVYEQLGGYEKLPFSVTEDYALFKKVTSHGYGFQQLASNNVLAFTNAEKSLADFIAQRRRWLGEFHKFPFWIRALILSTGLHFPFFCFLACTNFSIFVPCYLARFVLLTSILAYYLLKTKQTKLLWYVLFYDVFHLVFSAIFMGILLKKTDITWKGRTYTNPN